MEDVVPLFAEEQINCVWTVSVSLASRPQIQEAGQTTERDDLFSPTYVRYYFPGE